MKTEKKTHLVSFYECLIKKYGAMDVRSLDWSSRDSQRQRFEAIYSIADFNGKAILDVGCGFADFYDFLCEKGVEDFEYVGYDLVPKMMEIAIKKHPQLKIEVRDILADPPNRYDYVIANGLFGIKEAVTIPYMEKVIEIMFGSSNYGLAFTANSSYTPDNIRKAKDFYVSPENLFRFCIRLTPKVNLLHAYRSNDFCIHMYHI